MIDIWINCPDRAVARAIARALLEQRLAACANIGAEFESLYHWKNNVEQATEIPLLIKTRAALFDAVVEAARALHPDEVPAIHAIAAAAVTPDYLAWLEGETEPGPRP